MPRLFNPVTVFKLALSFLLIATSLTSLAVPAQKPLVLANPTAIVDVWPVVTMLHDPEGKLTISDVLAASDRFSQPQSAYATLGLRKKVVWLNVPILVPSVNAGPTTAVGAETKTTEQWILDIDYTLLNRIDVYLAADGRVVQQALLGNAQPLARRPILSRSHAVPIELRPGVPHTLLLRVETVGGYSDVR